MAQKQLTWDFFGSPADAERARRAAGAAAETMTEWTATVPDRVLALAVQGRAISRGYVRGETLAFHLAKGQRFTQSDGPPDDLSFEVLRSLPAASRSDKVGRGIATITSDVPDIVTVLAASAADASSAAAAIAGEVATSAGKARKPESDIWEHLSKGAKLATTLKGKGRLDAAVITWRGRGRIVGPLKGDLLMRFGVSTWR